MYKFKVKNMPFQRTGWGVHLASNISLQRLNFAGIDCERRSAFLFFTSNANQRCHYIPRADDNIFIE